MAGGSRKTPATKKFSTGALHSSGRSAHRPMWTVLLWVGWGLSALLGLVAFSYQSAVGGIASVISVWLLSVAMTATAAQLFRLKPSDAVVGVIHLISLALCAGLGVLLTQCGNGRNVDATIWANLDSFGKAYLVGTAIVAFPSAIRLGQRLGNTVGDGGWSPSLDEGDASEGPTCPKCGSLNIGQSMDLQRCFDCDWIEGSHGEEK